MSDDLKFSSEATPALEIVDILTNAVRRAMVGNLQFDGYEHLPNIMIHRNSHYIKILSLKNGQSTACPPYMSVLNHFRRGGKRLV